MNDQPTLDANRQIRPSLVESAAFLALAVLLIAFALFYLLCTKAWHYQAVHVVEMTVYLLLAITFPLVIAGLVVTRRSHREKRLIHPPMVIDPVKDARCVSTAWAKSSIVLGYDIHGAPYQWPDSVRTQQGIVLGMTGSGKTTLLKNVISQDMMRRIGPPEDRHKIPLIVFDGKGDLDFFHDLLPYVIAADRLCDLRLINPARPDLSCRYNPFHTEDDRYMEQVSMIFGSFNLSAEFFAKHQLTYLADIVRILHYAGAPFNFYDVMVAALDEEVLREQIGKARSKMTLRNDLTQQRRLNFDMSVRNLLQSFEDRDRVEKIRGLLNECMTFLDDELSVITGPYEDMLSLDDVISQELILIVSLNINRNSDAVKALGKMLIQQIQLTIGRRYESEAERKRKNKPLCSVVLDEFAPFGYDQFAQILQTARGTNTAFLFSMQSLPQLLRVSKGFKEDVSSAPATKMVLNTHDEDTARYFIRASAEHKVQKRTFSLMRDELFGWERFERGLSATEREEAEYRAEDERVKNMPKGQVQVLMSDATRGTIHSHLHVRPPSDVALPDREYQLLPRLKHSQVGTAGANLRFKNPELANSYGRRIQGRR